MWGLQFGILVLLCAQNSLYTLLRRYTRGVLKEDVSSSMVLLAAEVLKLLISCACLEKPDGMATLPGDTKSTRSDVEDRVRNIVYVLKHSRPMMVPAVTYLIMNTLSFKAMELVDATVFAMLAQLKTLTTAIFCWYVLGRQLSPPQWRAVMVLTMSVVIITYQRGYGSRCAAQTEVSAEDAAHISSFLLGVAMVLVETSLSGWISAYFEKHLKSGEFTVWARNLQLALWSIIIYGGVEIVHECMYGLQEPPAGALDALEVTLREGATNPHTSTVPLLARPIVGGFSVLTFTVVALGGGGGLLVAFAIKFADALLKSLATACALVAVVAAEMLFLGAPLDFIVVMAGLTAILGLQLYVDAPKLPQVEVVPQVAVDTNNKNGAGGKNGDRFRLVGRSSCEEQVRE